MKNPLKTWIEGDTRKLKRINKLALLVESYQSKMHKLTDQQLKNYTPYLQKQIQNGKTLDELLPIAFAVIREAAKRVLNMEPFHVQIMGGIILHQGNVAEMKTGEGKTLTATMPVYLNALSQKGVHVITVNDYLSNRDAHEMGVLYNWLGLSVGINNSKKKKAAKKAAYQCDIMYTTNSEIGFDYLKDNMAMSVQDQVQPKLNYALIDEVDSILIDEAKTPLIIAGGENSPQKLCTQADHFVKLLNNHTHYHIDKESNTIHLTDRGIQQAEHFFKVTNLYAPDQVGLMHRIQQALQANYNMKRDKDYLVKNNEIILIDAFTGRAMEGRRFSDGLHQAIEAKEFVKINKENKTMASINYQNLFRMYKKIAGMTGTGQTEKDEFTKVYNMDVIKVPTNRPIQRIDYDDQIFMTKDAKFQAVAQKIKQIHQTGQPILVGTVAVKSSEKISNLLDQLNIKHTTLNAKNNQTEAKIIKNAGHKEAITIATNMASRGTDIKLTPSVKKLGGLFVLGTERHESKRIDDQLRGRAGRQGDPGKSQFFVSLQDDLIKQYGNNHIKHYLKKHPTTTKNITTTKLADDINTAQITVESQNYSSRKENLKYDLILNQQRQVIYKQRNQVLHHQVDLLVLWKSMAKRNINHQLDTIIKHKKPTNKEYQLINKYIKSSLQLSNKYHSTLKNKLNITEIKKHMYQQLNLIEKHLKQNLTNEDIEYIIQHIIVKNINNLWATHLDHINELQNAVQLRSYAQKDANMEYQKDASKLFNQLIHQLDAQCTQELCKIKIEK